jgi:pimeloyl-ACP methyl ester carboxylesterase
MSVPLSVALPVGVERTTLGELAALRAEPRGVALRGQALLVPGYTGSKEDFLHLLPLLADCGWDVAAVDQRGQWESPMPDDPTLYSVAALGDAVLGAMRAHGTPLHVVGHSFGGIVVRDVAIREPAGFASLTLLGSGPGALGGPRAQVLGYLRPVLEQGGIEAVWQASESVAAADPRRRDVEPEVKDFLRARFLAQQPVPLTGMADAMLAEPDRVDELKAAYAGPLLVAHGAADDAWSPDEQRVMAQRLGAGYVVIEGSVHSPAAENPEHTAGLLDRFWSTQL